MNLYRPLLASKAVCLHLESVMLIWREAVLKSKVESTLYFAKLLTMSSMRGSGYASSYV